MEISWNFVSLKKWEPCSNNSLGNQTTKSIKHTLLDSNLQLYTCGTSQNGV